MIFAPSEILLTNAVINAARLGISANIFLGLFESSLFRNDRLHGMGA
jgi:hypothetical protein